MEILTHETDSKAINPANGFQMVPSCVLNIVALGHCSPAAVITLLGIISFVHATDRTAYAYRRTIAERTGQSISTVARHLSELQQAGLLQVTTDPFRGASFYRAVDPCGKCFGVAGNHAGPPSQKRSEVVSEPIPGRIKSETQERTKAIDLDQSIRSDEIEPTESEKTEAAKRITAKVQRRMDAGGIDNPRAYLTTALKNGMAEEVTEVRAERKQAAEAEACDDCPECDRNGYLWKTAEGRRVPWDDVDAATRGDKCHHSAEMVTA